MIARTQGWEARTLPAPTKSMVVGSHTHKPPSRTALAARSLLAVDRLPEGSPERSEAFRSHIQQFGTPLHRSCSLR